MHYSVRSYQNQSNPNDEDPVLNQVSLPPLPRVSEFFDFKYRSEWSIIWKKYRFNIFRDFGIENTSKLACCAINYLCDRYPGRYHLSRYFEQTKDGWTKKPIDEKIDKFTVSYLIPIIRVPELDRVGIYHADSFGRKFTTVSIRDSLDMSGIIPGLEHELLLCAEELYSRNQCAK